MTAKSECVGFGGVSEKECRPCRSLPPSVIVYRGDRDAVCVCRPPAAGGRAVTLRSPRGSARHVRTVPGAALGLQTPAPRTSSRCFRTDRGSDESSLLSQPSAAASSPFGQKIKVAFDKVSFFLSFFFTAVFTCRGQ